MNRYILTICLTAFSVFCLTNCGKKQVQEQTSKVIPVKVMNIGFSDHSDNRNYVGTVESSTAVSLSFSNMGTVERVLVSEGDRVKKGQLLAVLNRSTAQNSYDAAKSTLSQARDAYDRLKSLHEKGSLTDIKWIEAETNLEKAQSMEAITKKSLDDCNLYAPVNGVIATRSIEEGVNAMPGMAAFKLVSIHELNINVPVSENEIGSIKIGQKATITVPALDNRKYTGTVDKKGVEANPVSRSYAIKIKIEKPQSELMPGMVCKVSLQNEENRKIIIPNKSVQISPDNERFVWLTDGNTATRRFITVGALADYGIVVDSGLSEGDRLIIEGCNKISEGMKISIKN